VCLDTCHLFAAGHDLATRGGVAGLLGTLAPVMGRHTGPGCTSRLRLIHANDSKDGCGSHRDRHENIGAGQIGTAPFAALLRHPATRGVPFIVETPGPRAAVAADIATLKALRGKGQAARAPAGAMR
jgi:deoxyribonuclease-4